MNKKILSLVLALVMVLGTFANVFAAETTKKAEDAKKEAPKAGEKVEKIVGKDNKIQYIVDKKIVEGYEDGSMGYDKNITRAEITRLLVVANGNEALAKQLQGSMKIYSDVDTKHWANGVITVGTTKPSGANGIAMLAGYPDKSFKPEANVTYAELAKMLVVLVKKDLTADMVKNAIWASSWMTWAAQLGILDDVTVADSNAAATRADAFVMLYNALYKMQTFKRVPANAKLGVLSYLNKNGKLVLNQDEKEQTYTITADTVFVNSYKVGNENNANVIKVSNIVNPDYYLGSLVRIMVNDKKEVTHIIELGNPKYMALDNNRWRDVADETVSTVTSKIPSLKDYKTNDVNGYVTVGFNTDKTEVKTLTFNNYMGQGNKAAKVLDVVKNTRVFIANPYNNIMREVKDINEAMSLLGYNQARWEKIPNVYAGYDVDGYNKSAYNRFNQGNANTAKVVVFNVVAKQYEGQIVRVLNQANSLGNATLEDTDGKRVERNFLANLANYPFNYGNQYDVIRLDFVTNQSTDAIKTLIDADSTSKFPIVRVNKVYNDRKAIEVIDKYNDLSIIDLRDAKIFNAEEYSKLAKNDYVQFRTENGNDRAKATTNKIEILSILPERFGAEKFGGAIKGLVPVKSERAAFGKVVNVNNERATVTIDEYRMLNDVKVLDDSKVYDTSALSSAEATALGKVAGTDVVINYEVKSTKTDNLDGRIYNVKVEDEKIENYVARKEAEKAKADAKQALEAKIAEAETKVKEVKVSADGNDVQKGEKYATQNDIDAIKKAITDAKAAKDDSNKTAEELTQAKTTLEQAIATFDQAVKTKN